MEHSYASVVSRTADLLIRGPAPTPQSSHGRTTRLRRAGRDLALRLIRPYTTYQRQVDVALLDAVRIQARQAPALWERSEKQEALTEDLVTAIDALRRRVGRLEALLGADAARFLTVDTEVGEALALSDERTRDDVAAPEGDPYVPLLAGCAEVVEVSPGELGDGGPLATAQNASLDAVLARDLLDARPQGLLLELLGLARAKLAPGGVLIADGANPHSAEVVRATMAGLRETAPPTPEALLLLCASAGLGDAYVFAPGYPSFSAARYRAPRYAVVARRVEGPA